MEYVKSLNNRYYPEGTITEYRIINGRNSFYNEEYKMWDGWSDNSDFWKNFEKVKLDENQNYEYLVEFLRVRGIE